MTGTEILAIKMKPNDSGADTIKGYLIALLTRLWDAEEGFSGKRPFGNSGWTSDLDAALIAAGAVKGRLDDEGYAAEVDSVAANQAIFDAIAALA